MLIVIVIVFSLCWLPAHLKHLFIFFDEETYYKIPSLWQTIAFGVSQGNSSINPYLYIALNRNFRRAYVDVLRSCFSPAKNLVRSRGSNTTSNTTLTQGTSMEQVQVGGLGRRGVYEVSETKRDADPLPQSVRQISLMKVTDDDSRSVDHKL